MSVLSIFTLIGQSFPHSFRSVPSVVSFPHTSTSMTLMEPQQHGDVPHDMLIKIASLSSTTETLATLRATSKSLNLATYEPKYTPLHLMAGFLIQSLVKRKYDTQYVPAATADESRVSETQKSVSLNFLPFKVEINACSKALGVFYCESQEPQSRRNSLNVKNHYTCKAATREWIQIPNPKTKWETCLTGASGIVVMKVNPFKYKIVRFSSPKLNSQTQWAFQRYTCQVYDSEKPGKWKKLEKEVRLDEDGEWINRNSPMVTVNGNLHLLVGQKRILVFDPLTEEWNFIPTPVEIREEEDCTLHPKLFKSQGKLRLFVQNWSEKTLTVWMMEDYKNKDWTRSCQLSTQAVSTIDNLASLDGLCNSETGLFIAHNSIILYNFRDGSYKRHALEGLAPSIFFFQSDFKKIGWNSDSSRNDSYCRSQFEFDFPRTTQSIVNK